MDPPVTVETILIDCAGGPRDGARRDLTLEANGKWPSEVIEGRWPLTEAELTSGGGAEGRYIPTGRMSDDGLARVYEWQRETWQTE
jgi:hypothetical protein